ncbi:MAG: hypothetical protein ABIJ65_12170 [Chloroflexota bacterium]
MNSNQLLKIVELYNRDNHANFGEIKISRIPDWKTMFVEQVDGGRVVTMTECKVDGVTYWAGYSARSQTIFISLAG